MHIALLLFMVHKSNMMRLNHYMCPSFLARRRSLVNFALAKLQARNDEAERLFLRAFTGQKQQPGANHQNASQGAENFIARRGGKVRWMHYWGLTRCVVALERKTSLEVR